jgi:pimeloyl-ACP methyl ester carboxylesterase
MSAALKAWRDAGQYWQWQEHKVFWRLGGSGPALLLIHGYPVGSYDWHRIWPRLCSQYTVIAPDMLGMGFSDKPLNAPYSLAQHAHMHDDLLAHLGLASVHIVAFDLGVSVLQEMLALRASNNSLPRVDSVVFLNGGICPEAYRPRLIQKLLVSPLGAAIGPHIPEQTFARTITSLFANKDVATYELLQDFWALFAHNNGRKIHHRVGAFWRERLAQRERLVHALLQSGVSMRLINGAADPNSGQHMMDAFRRVKPGADIVSLAGVGHWPQLEAPEQVTNKIIEFVNGFPQVNTSLTVRNL